jgi:acyl carrier protein
VIDANGTEAQVREVVGKVLAVDESVLVDDAGLREKLGADSLAIAEIIADLEGRLGVELPESDVFVTEMRTVGDLVRAVNAAAA